MKHLSYSSMYDVYFDVFLFTACGVLSGPGDRSCVYGMENRGCQLRGTIRLCKYFFLVHSNALNPILVKAMTRV